MRLEQSIIELDAFLPDITFKNFELLISYNLMHDAQLKSIENKFVLMLSIP